MKNSDFVNAVERFKFNGREGMDALTWCVDTILEGDASTPGASADLDYVHDGLEMFLSSLPSQ